MLDKTKIKTDRIQCRIKETEAKRIREYCSKNNIGISDFLREAAIDYLNRKENSDGSC